MEETLPLFEYRCECGKLLFKGVLTLSLVEVKCRRCGSKLLTGTMQSGVCMQLECDQHFVITSASRYAPRAFGYEIHDLLGKQLSIFFPLLRDGETEHKKVSDEDRDVYSIRNNTLLLKDGGMLPMKTHLFPKKENGVLSGYRMVNWVTE